MSDLGAVAILAKRQREFEALVAQKELELKDAKEKLEQVATVDLPELMNELGIVSFKLDDGSSITIKKDLRAYIREEDKYSVFSWLRQNNNGGIIKTAVTANFGMGEEEKATQLYEELLSVGVKTNKKEEIHWMTLNKFVKERLEDGKELNANIQIQHIQEAKIK